jgi:hypothetical protein
MLKLGTAALAAGAVLTRGAGQAASAAPGPKSARPRFAPPPRQAKPLPTGPGVLRTHDVLARLDIDTFVGGLDSEVR